MMDKNILVEIPSTLKMHKYYLALVVELIVTVLTQMHRTFLETLDICLGQVFVIHSLPAPKRKVVDV